MTGAAPLTNVELRPRPFHPPTSVAESLQERSDRILEETLERLGARDPREFYRERLRELKQSDPGGYEKAVRHYRDVLLPSIVEDGVAPLAAWTEYGRALAELSARGRTVSVDASGRSSPYEAPSERDRLVLHLPEAPNRPALLVALPDALTPAQRATYDWLVAGKQILPTP